MAKLRQNAKLTTESQPGIDIRLLKRKGFIHEGFAGLIEWKIKDTVFGSVAFEIEEKSLILIYNHTSNPSQEKVVQPVKLIWVPCNYGGKRVWFLCPKCGRRAAIVYATKIWFACRLCAGLTHRSQQEKPFERLVRKAEKIRSRLDENSYILTAIPSKPKGMHWEHYWNLSDEIEDVEDLIIEGMVTALGEGV